MFRNMTTYLEYKRRPNEVASALACIFLTNAYHIHVGLARPTDRTEGTACEEAYRDTAGRYLGSLITRTSHPLARHL